MNISEELIMIAHEVTANSNEAMVKDLQKIRHAIMMAQYSNEFEKAKKLLGQFPRKFSLDPSRDKIRKSIWENLDNLIKAQETIEELNEDTLNKADKLIEELWDEGR